MVNDSGRTGTRRNAGGRHLETARSGGTGGIISHLQHELPNEKAEKGRILLIR